MKTPDQESIADQIIKKIDEASILYYRLILIVGHSGSGKTLLLKRIGEQTSLPLINLGLELSRRLLDLTLIQRALKLPVILDEIIRSFGDRAILLDNTEILLDVNLKHDPLTLLKKLSRNRTIVASWNGSITDNKLVYGEPWHREYGRYPLEDIIAIDLAGT